MSSFSYPNETPKAASAFQQYCLLGPSRSFRILTKQHQNNIKTTSEKSDLHLRALAEWSAKYHWQERVKDYDREQSELQRIARADAIAKYQESELQLASELKTLIVESLRKQVESHVAPASALVAALKLVTEMQRSALGLDDVQRVEVSGINAQPINFSFNSIIATIEAGSITNSKSVIGVSDSGGIKRETVG